MRLYYFTTAEHGLAAIRDRRVKISEIQSLNDPFEFMSANLGQRKVRAHVKRIKQNASKVLGIVCLSSDWRHPMMWGHYANCHRGICLGFDTDTASKVDYISERPNIELSIVEQKGTEEKKEFVKMLLATKFDCWSYEKEYRLFVKLEQRDPVNELHFKNFSSSFALKGVIVGSQSDVSRQRVERALGELADEVDYFKSRPAFATFKVVKDRSKWK